MNKNRLKVLNVALDTAKHPSANQILVRTTGHVTLMNSSCHFALVLILILGNIVKQKKSLLILAMDINVVQLESALQMAKHTHVTVVTAVTLVTCVTFHHVTILLVVTMDRAVLLLVLQLVIVTLDILVTNVTSVLVTPRIAVTTESALSPTQVLPNVIVLVDSPVKIVTLTHVTRHLVVLKALAPLTNGTLLAANVKLDGTVTNVKTTIVTVSRVKTAVHVFLKDPERDANVKIITLETFVKRWTHSHMHTKPLTVLPVHSSSSLLLMFLGHSDLQTISSGTFKIFLHRYKIREISIFIWL